MVTVMVTGVGSNIGQGIIKALNLSSLNCKIIGTDYHPLAAGLFRCDKGYLVPPAASENWLDKIVEICNRELVDAILIGSDGEVPFFSINKSEIVKATSAIVLVCNPRIVEFCHDKWKTFEFLSRYDIDLPKTCLNKPESVKDLKKQVGFPLVVKPRVGAGSNDIHVVHNERQLEFVLTCAKESIVQEYLDGDEYTSGIFLDKESNFKGIISMKRELTFGTTYRAVVGDSQEVNDQIVRVSKILSRHGAIGSINIQSRCVNGRVYIFEINPRFSGTTAFRSYLNFNEVEAVLKNFLLGEEVYELRPSTGVIMRYWDEIYTSMEEAKCLEAVGHIEKSQCILPRAL